MDYSGLSVCLSVCLLVTFVSSAKTAEPIEVQFGLVTRMGPKSHVLDGGADPQGNGLFREAESGGPL